MPLENFSIEKRETIYIKMSIPFWSIAKSWGDYYLALGLKKYFNRKGYKVVLHCQNEWDRSHKKQSIVLVLRGLYEYTPRAGDLNLMWNISHPDSIEKNEYLNFDHVFVSSKKLKDNLTDVLGSKVSLLDQCTDSELFYKRPDVLKEYDLLFVGNTRKIFRPIVKQLISSEYKFGVIGEGWEEFIDKKYIVKHFVKNSELNFWYNKTEILLNDHWGDMRQQGFVSNRIFDGLAAGCKIISDKPEGDLSRLEKFSNLYFYESEDNLHQLVNKVLMTKNTEPEIKELSTHKLVVKKILKKIKTNGKE